MKSDFLLVTIRSLQKVVADLKQVVSSIKLSKQEVFEKCIMFLLSSVVWKSPVTKKLLQVF